jgi:hypothetical protein
VFLINKKTFVAKYKTTENNERFKKDWKKINNNYKN